MAWVGQPRLLGAALYKLEEVLQVLHGVLLPLAAKLLVTATRQRAEQRRRNARLKEVQVHLHVA